MKYNLIYGWFCQKCQLSWHGPAVKADPRCPKCGERSIWQSQGPIGKAINSQQRDV